MSTLLSDIEGFLIQHDLAPTRFGDEAMGDRHLVRQLRAGRFVFPKTERRIRQYMERKAGEADHAASDMTDDAEPSPGNADDLSAVRERAA